uniref:tape measure protein n=1 Tax=Limnobaculum xujianqingii TaxID=2738837 RepID=UPI0015BE30FA|nr:tape measure protein [Limnobaculum xujianqingii]
MPHVWGAIIIAPCNVVGSQAAAASRDSQLALSSVTAQLSEAKNMALGMAGAFAGAFATRNLIQLADSYNSLSARIKLATTDAGDFSNAQSGLMEISQRTGSALADNAALFSRTSASLREWGYGTQDILKLTDALSTGLQVSGATAQETSSAITQLSQALGRGVLRGQDFNSVAQSSPRLMKALADGMGVAQKDLKGLADAGALTTDKIVPALIGQVGKLRSEFESMPNSVSAASTRIANAFLEWVGGANQASGATAGISGVLDGVAKNIDSVALAGGVLVSVGLARAVGGWASSLAGSTRQLISSTQSQLALAAAQREGLTTSLSLINAERAGAVAAQKSLVAQLSLAQTEQARAVIRRQLAANSAEVIRLTRAEAAATAQLSAVQSRLAVTSGLASKALGLLGGPVGAAMLAAGAIFYFHQKSEQARESAIAFADSLGDLEKSLNSMSEAQLRANKAKLLDSEDAQYDSMDRKRAELERIRAALEKYKAGQVGYGDVSSLYIRWLGSEEELLRRKSVLLGELELDQKRLNQTQETSANVSGILTDKFSWMAKTVEALTGAIESASPATAEITKDFEGFGKAADSLALQLDVSRLNAAGAAREAYILAGLQKVAGDAALKHKDDLLALAKGQVMSGAISEELALRLTDYAAKLGQVFDDGKQTKALTASHKAANGIAQSYQRQLESLDQQIALFGQTTEVAKQRYQLAHGELKSLDAAKKAAIEQRAIEIDRLNAKKAYQDTMSDLQTAEEKALSTVKERLKTIRDAKLSADELAVAIEKASKASITEAPKFGGVDASIGGASGELIRVADAEEELQKWNEKQLEMQKQLLDEKEINERTYADRVAEINQQNSERLEKIQSSYRTATLSMFSSLTGDAAALMEAMGQKGSAVYKAMFLASKAASIAQAIINTEEAATKAMAQGGMFMGVPMASVIRGVGYTSVALMASTTLAGMAHDGIDNVPREGTWLLDRGERVVDARTNADLKDFLASGNSTDPLAGNSSPVVIHQHITVQGNGDAALMAAMREAASEGAKNGAALARQEMLNDFQTRGQGRKLLGV